MKKLKNILKQKWFLLEKYNDFPPLVLFDFIHQRSFKLKKNTGYYLNSAIFYDKNVAYTCFEKNNFLFNKKILFKKIIANPSYFIYQFKREIPIQAKWYEYNKKIVLDLRKGQLPKTVVLNKWHSLFIDTAMVGQPINIIEFDEAWLSEVLNSNKSKSHYLKQIAFIAMEAKKKRYTLYLDYKNTALKLVQLASKLLRIKKTVLLNLNFQDFLKILTNQISLFKSHSFTGNAIFYDGLTNFLSKEETKRLINKIAKKPKTHLTELKGQPGVKGFIRGKVCVILSKKDLNKMKFGQILVAHTTTVDLMSAVKKSSAIITDMGGITSHGAIISREFNIPAVIGTKIATLIFKDGDLVEVDANKGVVRKL